VIPFTQWLFAYGPIVAAVAAYVWIGQVAARGFLRRFKGRIWAGLRPPFLTLLDDGAVVAFFVFSLVMVGSAVALGLSVARLMRNHPDRVHSVGGLIAIVLIAIQLFRIKLASLRLYAILEVAFGLISAQQTVGKLKDTISPVEALTLFASAYLLIKGMDDYKKDRDERKKKEHPQLEATG